MNLIKVTNTKNKIVVNKTDNTIKVIQRPNKIIVKNVGIQGPKGDSGDGITHINELTEKEQFIEIGTDGNDINIVSAVDTHTINIPTASATKRGALDSADYTNFNSKQDALGFTPEDVANKENTTLDTSTTKYPTNNLVKTNLDLKADETSLQAHIDDLNNPHATTKDQVGLGNADDTSDLDKPISTATQTALDTKVDEINITAGSLGSPSKTPSIAYNEQGQITTASEQDIQIAQSQVDNLTTDLSGKEPTITAGTSSQYYRGDKTFQTLDTSVVPDTLDKRYVSDAQLTVLGNTSGTNTGDNATNTTSNTYANGKVADAINDGVTTIAPSQNAVFDALALKAPLASPALTGTTTVVNITGSGVSRLGSINERVVVGGGIATGEKGLIIRYDSGTNKVTLQGQEQGVSYRNILFQPISGGVEFGGSVDIAGSLNLAALTASTALALNASKDVISVTNTGSGNNVLSNNPTFTGTANFALISATGNIAVSSATAGGNRSISVTNTDNTSANSNAVLNVSSGGASSGDAGIILSVGVGSNGYVAKDNSDSDALVIGHGAIGAGNAIRISTSNVVSLPQLTASTSLRLNASKEIESVAGGYALIDSQTLAVNATTVSFTFPAGFKALKLIGKGRSTRAAAIGAFRLRFNGDGATNYTDLTIRTVNATVFSGPNISSSSIIFADVPAASKAAQIVGSYEMSIPDYSNTSYFKSLTCQFTSVHNTAADCFLGQWSGSWNSTAAITNIEISELFGAQIAAGTSFHLYGLY